MEIVKTTEVIFNKEDIREFLISKNIITSDQQISHLRLLKSSQSMAVSCFVCKPATPTKELSSEELEKVLTKPIEELNISVKTRDALRRASILDFKSIMQYSENGIRKFRFIGKMGVIDISNSLETFGIKWPKD